MIIKFFVPKFLYGLTLLIKINMISAVKTIIVAIIVIGVAAPTAYFAYNYLNAPPVEITHFIPENVTGIIHIQNNTSNVYLFGGSNFIGGIFNYSMNTFTGRLNTISNSSSSSNVSSAPPSHGKVSSNVSIQFYENYLGYSIYSISDNLSNISILHGNTSAEKAILNGNSLNTTKIFLASIESSYVTVGNLNSVIYSINAYHNNTYLKNDSFIMSRADVYDSFYLNFSSNQTLYKKALEINNVNSNFTNFSRNLNFSVYGNITYQSSNLTIKSSNTTFLTDVLDLVTHEFNNYITSAASLNGGHEVAFYFNIGLKNGSLKMALNHLLISSQSS